jgi:hypothetical protein
LKKYTYFWENSGYREPWKLVKKKKV